MGNPAEAETRRGNFDIKLRLGGQGVGTPATAGGEAVGILFIYGGEEVNSKKRTMRKTPLAHYSASSPKFNG